MTVVQPANGDAPAQDAAAQRSPRLSPADLGVGAAVRLMPGGDALIVNLSTTGILVEGKGRLAVESAVTVRVRGRAIRRLSGKVQRSRVSTIHRDGTLSYESAIEFEQEIALDDLAASAPAPSGAADGPEEVYVLDLDSDW